MIIETHNLTKRFGRTDAVNGVSLAVPEGATVALVGANGAGKTTTLRMLANLVRPDSGEAMVLGVDSRRLGPAEYARIGYVSENQKLPGWMRVDAFFAYLRPLYATWDTGLEDELRRSLDLPADRKIAHLSRGMRMKLSLATALAFRPALLLLDEPLSALDPFVRNQVMSGLLASTEGATILMSSHELTEIEGVATHLAFMAGGRILVQDTLEAAGRRFVDVTAGFAGDPDKAGAYERSWLSPRWSGRTLRFMTTAYGGDESALRKDLTTRFGPLAHLSAAPLSLREISTALIGAHREDQ